LTKTLLFGNVDSRNKRGHPHQ